MTLPATTDDPIFNCLSPKDLISYSRTCRDAYGAVKSYEKRAFSLEKLLLPYFSVDELDEFRGLQATTGALISGSTALQFFLRTTFDASDLDIYVDRRYVLPIQEFLTRIGYVYHPSERRQGQSLEDAVMSKSANDAHEPYYVHQTGIWGVYDMYKVREGYERKIQIITTSNSPVEVVLNFHSTCVMQIVSHSHAYSLYPHATFEGKLSLACGDGGRNGPAKGVAREKYAKRGWTTISADGVMMHFPTSHSDSAASNGGTAQRKSVVSFYIDTRRHLGDRFCWVIPLPPITKTSSPTQDNLNPIQIEGLLNCRLLECNSWTTVESDSVFWEPDDDTYFPISENRYCLCSDPRFRYSHCVMPTLVMVLEPEREGKIKRSSLICAGVSEKMYFWPRERREVMSARSIEQWFPEIGSRVHVPSHITYDIGFSWWLQMVLNSLNATDRRLKAIERLIPTGLEIEESPTQ